MSWWNLWHHVKLSVRAENETCIYCCIKLSINIKRDGTWTHDPKITSSELYTFATLNRVISYNICDDWYNNLLLDRISNEDYEHVLSLASRKECKAFLYSLLRKQRHEEELKNKEENQIVADETEHEEGEEDFEEIPYEIFTLLKNQDSEVDPRVCSYHKTK